MLRVGLTGGLGAGKSTAARMFAERGAVVLSSDEIGRELMQPGETVYAAIVERFGPEVMLKDGTLDRAALAGLAFDRGRAEELNEIVHPVVIARQEELMRTLPPEAIAVIESALLFETKHSGRNGWRTRFDRIILVTAPEEVKIARFVERAGATPETRAGLEAEARRRLAAQMPDAEKITFCNYVLANNDSLTELRARVETVWEALKLSCLSSQRGGLMRCAWLTICLLFGSCAMRAEHLRSPWDGQTITPMDAAYTCPSPQAFATTVNPGTYYIDEHASIIDPKKQAAYQQATEAATHFSQEVALAADAWLAKGSVPAARCVYTLLSAAAAAHAWAGEMPEYSGVYTQNWLLSAVAISYLKVRNSHVSSSAQVEEVQRWFDQLARRVTNFFIAEASRLGNEKENNHMYWAGLALTAEGIANEDLLDYSWGIGAYEIGVNNIQPDGSLVAEMARGQMALHYHLYALAPLVITAELVEANGMNLYADKNGMIHRLVALCVAGLDDPTLFEKRTGVKQLVTRPYAGGDIGWAVPYVKRFPNARLSAWTASAPWVRYTTWGGAPPNGDTNDSLKKE